jgi:PAS domain S-box-containing protein
MAGSKATDVGSDRVDDGREALAKYKVLVEHLPAVVYTSELGTDGEWLYVSPKIEEILGWTAEEWMAHDAPWTTSVHPEDLDRAIAEEAAAAASGGEDRLLTSEYRMFTRDGRVLWIRDESTIVHDENGTPLCLQGVLYDVSDSKRAEEERDFQARLLGSISDAVIAYDAHDTVTAWNRAAESLYGWPAVQTIGAPLPPSILRDEADVAAAWDPFVQAMHGWRGVGELQDKDGYALTVEMKCVPLLDADGNARGWVRVDREVAET